LVESLVEVADPAAWPGIQRGFECLHERILAHEEAETEVLHCAYLADLGGSG